MSNNISVVSSPLKESVENNELFPNYDKIENNTGNRDNESISNKNKKEQNVTFMSDKSSKKKKRALRYRNQINRLMKQSNDIKNSYKPGIFEEVINGPRGPDIRLHRHNLIVGLLKLFLILFLTAGIVLLSVIMLCIIINVGYVCVQIDNVNSALQLLFFAFYYDAIYYISKSFWRTYLRSLHTIINANFGASIYDIFIKRILGYFISLKISVWTMPERYQSHPKDWYEKINLIVFILFLFILALPVLIIAIVCGYWKVTEVVCLTFVGGGAITIVFLNLFSRVVLFTKFFRRLDEFYYNAPFFVDINERIDNQTSYLRLTYCTTNGLDGGEKSINYILDLIIHMIIVIGVAAFIFGSFDPDVWKITAIIVILIILLPIRYRVQVKKFLVKLHILSQDKENKKYENTKNRVNAEMDAMRKTYLDNRKVDQDLGSSASIKSPRSVSSISSSQPTSPSNPLPKSGWNRINIREIKNLENKETLSPQINATNGQEGSESIQINITSPDDPSSPSINSSRPSLTPVKDKKHSIDSSHSVDASSPVKSISSSFPEIRGKPLNNGQDYLNSNLSLSNSIKSSVYSSNIAIASNEDHFAYILQSDKSYIRRKALLTWDIKTLISWKGCLTVFLSRCVKYIVGITLMAILNYYRYSVGSDEVTTSHHLLKDIITHIVFIIVVLSQDIIYLIPMNTSKFSMKVRKITFLLLLIFELILVVSMRVIIKNIYIPMAFIVLAYANFTVYPDPRYTWDDENVPRKTLFDLFRPQIDLRSDISFRHFVKQKGYNKSKARKMYRKNKKYRPVQITGKPRENAKTKDDNNSSETNSNSNATENNSNLQQQAGEQTSIHSEEHKDTPNQTLPTATLELTGLNDEAIHVNENKEKNSVSIRSDNNVYIDIPNANPYEFHKKYDPSAEFNKVVNYIKDEMQYKRNTRARYNSIAIIIVIAITILLSIIIGIIFAQTTQEEDYSLDPETTIFHQKPAICQWRGNDISINEFAALSCACYYSTMEDITYSWQYGRPQSSSNNFTIGENSLNSNSGGVQYVDFVNKEKDIIVVAVRGTSTVEDIFQDIYIWSASSLLQLSGFFGTFIKFWPRDTIASLVRFIVKQFTNLQLLYWVNVEEHIKKLQETTNSTIYLTGHSLGGGVAGVISAHLNIPAITFSSPGLGFSYKTYDIELEKLIRNFVNVVPMSDPVPLLDSQVGQIQNIECNTEQPLSCHSIYNTMDTLNAMCHESSVYRYWDDTAEAKINGEDLPYIMPY
ncbi:hypothetical protein BCR36DRAFT_586908 [Piromyces finnis]|uniref:Fungal lipase-type domain-containing protein n=1 Tax=Piromyces finnis TaxID=1754191 RepID=A0A1Y1UXJ5_9FUNG|nr:hypothetical protein BCR36DRAFT_586908 [Piromyces finnis]|eukprot:ORX42978.1 hypothetical protein BCR36DRAFT_586908 [Piromyces finnis]